VANTDSWGKLSKTQQGWLVQAAKAALPASAAPVGDTEEIANMCRRNRVKIISASDGQIAQLRDAFSPVDRWLHTDGTTAGYLDRIHAIKSQLGAKVSGQPIDCAELTHRSGSSTRPAGSASAIDGNYFLSYTVKEMHAGASPDGVGCKPAGTRSAAPPARARCWVSSLGPQWSSPALSSLAPRVTG
jgi:hypothetical protein